MTSLPTPAPAVDRNVAAGALMTCMAIGIVFSLAVYLDPMGADTGWSRSGISTAMTIRRHGRGAHDHRAAGGMAGDAARLARHAPGDRHRGLGGAAAGVWFIRRSPPSAASSGAPGAADSGPSASEALRSRAFLVLAAAFFACCAAHSGPIFHTVSYAIGCGLPMVSAVTIYSMEGAAGLGGRLLFGVLADRLGAKRVLVAGLLVQAVAAASYPLVRQLDGFYAVAIVFGAAYGGVMPLYATLVAMRLQAS